MDRAGPASKHEITDLLGRWVDGDRKAADRLFSTLYQELRNLARRQLHQRPRDGTLDTTALIHEAFLKLADVSRLQIRDRGHFLSLASRVMRQIFVDSARRKSAAKRGGSPPLPLADDPPAPGGRSAEELLALDEALVKLESLDLRLARVVDLRFFGGLSIEETAEALDISVATLKRDWLRARAYLFQQIRPAPTL
jgi:RNA polymerase sigma factor (TIGR02999 family)